MRRTVFAGSSPISTKLFSSDSFILDLLFAACVARIVTSYGSLDHIQLHEIFKFNRFKPFAASKRCSLGILLHTRASPTECM